MREIGGGLLGGLLKGHAELHVKLDKAPDAKLRRRTCEVGVSVAFDPIESL